MEAAASRLKTSATSTTTTTSTSLSGVDHHQHRSTSDGSIGHVHDQSLRGGAVTRGLFLEENTSKPSSNNHNTFSFGKEDEEIKSTKAEMVEVREENARLKMLLEKIENEYETLQTRFTSIIQQLPKKNSTAPSSTTHEEDNEGLSLRLGRTQSGPKREEITSSSSKNKENEEFKEGDDLKLGLNISELKSEQSPENSLEVVEKEEHPWPPSKVLKTARSEDQDELLAQQASVKRARVSVRTRCDTPTMNDGCQWRKYGQKISKGNPCPRAYYRCTVAPACPVRKQVQRCVEDMSILITTYEGTHSHPLPIAATAMASTTSAAASMLMSGSSTSQPGLSSSATAASPQTNLHGLNFNLSNNSRPYYSQQNPSSSQVSPTITLDLTSNPNPNNPFSMFPSTTRSFPSTSLNFSSPDANNFWGNGSLNYGALPYNKPNVGSFNIGRPSQEQYYQPYSERNNNQASSQQLFTETLTKAITTDPSFRSVIATAISSMVGRNQSGAEEGFGQNLNSNPLSGSTKNCSTFLNRTSSLNSQTGSLQMLLQQVPQPFSLAKNASAATGDHVEHNN